MPSDNQRASRLRLRLIPFDQIHLRQLVTRALSSLWLWAGLLGLVGCAGSAQTPPSAQALPSIGSEPYAILRQAYLAKDGAQAATAYTTEAALIYADGPGGDQTYQGTDAIAQSFQNFFDQIADTDVLDLNFRLTEQRRAGDALHERGLYRLRVGEEITGYGSFEVIREGSGIGRFRRDTSSPATREDFENAPGPVLLEPDQDDLDPAYYSRLTGRYRQPDGCDRVVTSSPVRLFVRDTCTNAWRGLTRVSGREWTAGDRVLSDSVVARYTFVGDLASPSLRIESRGGTVEADRQGLYRVEPISFDAIDGVTLAGDLYLPGGDAVRRPAVVLVHGSGPQDRRGYASILQVFADALAAEGVIVLTFDKRGVGRSGGTAGEASFSRLGGDVRAALIHLRARPDVDPDRVGVAGSSQAGWVVAKAIEEGADPAGVFLLGAAGAALTVPEQNLYNTDVRMQCAGLRHEDIDLALAQQRAFFSVLTDPSQADTLDRLTAEGRQREALADWLFPASSEIDRQRAAWFTTLELGFDPLPVWAASASSATFVFAEHDDATPTDLAVQRLEGLGHRVQVLEGAQHLGLRAEEVCEADLTDARAFHPGLFDALAGFATRLGS